MADHLFTYACDHKPPSMENGCPDGLHSFNEQDTRGVFGIARYRDPLPKSDEDIFGMRLVDGPYGEYQVSGITKYGQRKAQKLFIGTGYEILKRADFEAIKQNQEFKALILEWRGIVVGVG